MKGRLMSVPPEILLEEAKDLLRQGVRELNLVAQDISVYGTDLGRDDRLPSLLRALCAVEGDFWVRCLYCYPGGVSDELIEAMAAEAKIVPYLDIPLQHLDRTMLDRMKRPGADLDATGLVDRLRRSIPDLTLRTTMLVGFPGETPAAHRRMLEGMRALRFDRLGAFEYSREEGTPAAQAPRQVGKTTREKRWHAVMALQAEIAARLNAARIGRIERVLVEGYEKDRNRWVARSAADAPEVDGRVYMESGDGVRAGEFVMVEITGADVYDVTAVSTQTLFP
jgi:ribosomal protein S12 methylthiotransferase